MVGQCPDLAVGSLLLDAKEEGLDFLKYILTVCCQHAKGENETIRKTPLSQD